MKIKSRFHLLCVTNSKHKNITKENLGASWKTQLSLTLQLDHLSVAKIIIPHVTESKLVLLTTKQASKLSQVTGKRMSDFIPKSSREDGGLGSGRITLSVRNQASFILKG